MNKATAPSGLSPSRHGAILYEAQNLVHRGGTGIATYARALAPDLSLTASYILLTVCHGVSGHLRLASHMPVGAGALAVLRPTFGPVRSSTVSARLGLPEETVRRHLKRLVEIGFLCRTSRGYDIVHDGATLPAWRLYQKRSQANARQLIWRLTTTGVIPSSD